MTLALGGAALGLGTARGFRSAAGRFRSAAGGLASRSAAALLAAMTVEQAATVTAALRSAALGSGTARRFGRTAARFRGAAARFGRTTRRFGRTTATAEQAGFRLRSGKHKQAGEQKGRQHDPGFHRRKLLNSYLRGMSDLFHELHGKLGPLARVSRLIQARPLQLSEVPSAGLPR